MNDKISSLDKEFTLRISEVLHYLWDPIGVAGIPEARDEYDSYVLPTIGRLSHGKKKDEIEKYLLWLAGEHIGVQVTPELRQKTKTSIEVMQSWREYFESRLFQPPDPKT